MATNLYKLACKASLWYNNPRNIVVSGGAGNTPDRIHSSEECIVDTIPHSIPQDKPHYVYELAYPESMGGRVFYVGKGMNARIYHHEFQARNGVKSKKCSIIRKIWNNGEGVVRRKLAYFETHEEACMYEIALIFFMDGLTNTTQGGDGAWGLIHTEEVRRVIGDASRGKVVSEETRQRMSEAAKRRVISEETRRKIGDARRGKSTKGNSAETRRKIGDANRGRVRTEEDKQKNREAHTGKVYSEATRQKVRDARLGKKASEETRQNIRAAALQREARKRERRSSNG